MGLHRNRVLILGNLGQDPEIRRFPTGGKVASLSVATSRRWKNRQTGEFEERTEWHRVSVTADFLVDLVERDCRKGDRVDITGRLETRKWQDQSGQDRYTTEIVVAPYDGDIIPLGRHERRGDQGSPDGPPPAAPPRDIDDEIPF